MTLYPPLELARLHKPGRGYLWRMMMANGGGGGTGDTILYAVCSLLMQITLLFLFYSSVSYIYLSFVDIAW